MIDVDGGLFTFTCSVSTCHR